MKKFIDKLNHIIVSERYIKIYNTKFDDLIVRKFSRKEIIFGFGLLKLLNESLKYFEEEDWKLIFNEGISESYMFDSYFGDLARFFRRLRDLDQCNAYPIPIPSVPNGFDELMDLADVNRRIHKGDEKTWDELIEKYSEDPLVISEENEEALTYYLTLFILNFDENIKEIFNKMDFMELMMQYEVKGSLSYVLSELNKINLPEKYFSSLNMLVNIIDEFIDILCNREFDDKSKDFFKHDEKPINSESNDLMEEYLVQFIFNNTYLEKYDEINIYDPCCDNVNLIFNAIKFIKSKNNNCNVNFYGKLNFKNSIFNTTKVIMHSYLNDNNIFLSPSNKLGFPFEYISLEKMDFIISDYRAKNLYEDNHFLLPFQYKLDYSSKLVAIFNKKDFYNSFMDFAVLNDNLESIITFHNSFILILNSNKIDYKKNKFLLVDYALSDKEFIYKIKYHHYSKSTNIKNIPINHTHMNQILKSYVDFTNTSFSKVILNNDAVKDYFHTESEKYWGYNSKCPDEVTKYSNKKIEDRGGCLNLAKDMNYYLQEFNFNDLLYDLKNKSYSLVKQKYQDNKIEFVEEKLEFVPLHSLITFDIGELNVENPNEYKIDKYGYSFYVNSYKILRNFLVYYLDSEEGKKEYDYFENSFGFENDYKLTAVNQNMCKLTAANQDICKFIYIRIPLVDIETQEYILVCENKNMFLSDNNLFTLAILLKDFNKDLSENFVNYLSEKIDDTKDQIIEHSDNNTKKIIDEIDKLGEQLKEFNVSLENRRKNIRKELENAKDNDIKLEKIYNKFNHDSAEEIKNSVENCICEDDYNKEEKNLIKTLGESAWNKLSNQSKRFLISSKITFNTLYKLGDIIDYSGVCLLVTKSLEVELTKRFYMGFYEYLEDKDMSFGEYHTSLVVNEYGELKKLPEYRWTLGGIPYILCYKKHPNPEIHEKNVSILIKYSKEKLFRDLSDEEIRETLRKYGDEIKNLTYRYRNPAAHTNELQCRQAKQCLDYVIDVEHFLKIMLDSFDKEDDV